MLSAFVTRILDIVFPESARARRVRADTEALPLAPRTRTASGRIITALAPYAEKRVEEAICSVKFERSRAGAMRLAAMLDDFLAEHLAERALFGEAPALVVPIPLGTQRKVSRGENQVVLVLQESRLVREGALQICECLSRTRETVPQTSLKRAARLTNMRGAFAVSRAHAAHLKGARILLIDDVSTTGATLSEAAEALKGAGASVECLALAG